MTFNPLIIFLEVKDGIIRLNYDKLYEYPITFESEKYGKTRYIEIIIIYNNIADFMKLEIKEDSKFKLDFGVSKIKIDILQHHANYGSKLELLIWSKDEFELRERLRMVIGNGVDNL